METLKRLEEQQKQEKSKTPREKLLSILFDRGQEVLAAAERAYPKETAILIEKLVEYVENGSLKGPISGGELLRFFRSLGMRIHIETSIKVETDGKLVPLAEKLRTSAED